MKYQALIPVIIKEKKKKERMSSAKILSGTLTYSTLWANSADDKLIISSDFSQETGFDISCKLSHMKCQNLFSGKKVRKIFQYVVC